MLGQPSALYPTGEWEVYKKLGNGIAFAGIVPFPAKDGWVHYLLITYNSGGRVSAFGTTADWTSSKGEVWESWSGSGVYAGGVGFYTGTNQPFISVDLGGEVDSAWIGYLILKQHYLRTDRTSLHIVIRQLCRASSLGHPSAFSAIGNIYRYGSYNFYRDNNRACFWHTLANNNTMPSWCDDVLTPDATHKVKHLVEQWQPDQCNNEVLSHVPD
jgi:hypothetical protein